jgi:TonB family protein
MKTTQRCLVASVIIHATLLSVLLFAPAFTQPPPPSGPVLELVPTDLKLTDGDKIGGGNPNAQPPKTAPQVPPASEPRPPEPKPETVKPMPRPPETVPASKPDVVKTSPKPVKTVHVAEEPVRPKPDAASQDTDAAIRKTNRKPVKTATEIKVADAPLKRSKKDDDEDRQAAEEAAADKRRKARAEQVARLNEERQRIANSIGGAAQAVGKSLAGTTAIEMPGPGGQAYAPYGSYLGAFYKERWRKPSAASARSSFVVAEVDVARDGRVLDWRLAEKSGQRDLDDSVSAVLRNYRQLRPLPEGTPDAQRTFRIKFTLEADTNT